MDATNPTIEEREEALKGAAHYLRAREQFHECVKRCGSLLEGNDNFIGRISEMLVMDHLLSEGYTVERPSSKSNKGFDLEKSKDEGEPSRVSVKCITWENQSERSSKVVLPDGIELSDTEERQPLGDLSILLVILESDLSYAIHDVTQGKWQSRKSRYISKKDVEESSPFFSGSLAT